MIEMSPQQMSAFGDRSLDEFIPRLVGVLAQSFPAMYHVPEPEMHAFVKGQIQQAQKYGFETEQDFAIYVIAAWLLGPDFDTKYKPPQIVFNDQGFGRDDRREWLLTWTYEFFAEIARDHGAGDDLKGL